MKEVKSTFWSTLSVFLLAIVVGCADVIDLGTQPGESRLLIFGRITSGLEGNVIEIARTSAINSEQSPVENASVFVVSESGQREQYQAVSPGVYQLINQTLIGQPGTAYHMEVTLNDGTSYRSVPAVMPERVASDQLDFEARRAVVKLENNRGTVSRNVVEFYMTTQVFNPEQDAYIRWNFVETYLYPERPQEVSSPDFPPPWCYITHDLEGQQVFLYDGSELRTETIARRLMATIPADENLVSEYYFQAVQSSLTFDAFRYWSDLNQVSNSQGTIFDRPMGPVVSNIFNTQDPDEEVLGYFEVSKVDTTILKMSARDIPFPVGSPCPIVGVVGEECLNCLLLDNSVKVKPYFAD